MKTEVQDLKPRYSHIYICTFTKNSLCGNLVTFMYAYVLFQKAAISLLKLLLYEKFRYISTGSKKMKILKYLKSVYTIEFLFKSEKKKRKKKKEIIFYFFP